MQNYISNLSNKSYKYPYFRSIVPKDLLTHFDGITEFRLSLNCVRKEDKQILCLNLKQITDKVFDEKTRKEIFDDISWQEHSALLDKFMEKIKSMNLTIEMEVKNEN